MIKEIIIEYFEIWEKVHFVFSEGVNYIIGDNDQGKSSIRKALNWVRTNRPAGEAFRNRKHKDKDTTATIVTSEGYVKRVRGKKNNYYELNGVKLDAVGRSKVPKEVEEFLDLDDINIQNQFDPFFLLQDPPPLVARKFNEYVGLSLIDKVAKEAEATVRSFNREVNQYKDQAAELNTELIEYKDIDTVGIFIDKAKKLETKLTEDSKVIGEVESLLIDFGVLNNELKTIPNLTTSLKLLTEASNQLFSIHNIESDIDTTEDLIESFDKFEAESNTLKNLPEVAALLQRATKLQKTLQIDSESILQVEQHLDSYNLLSLSSGENVKELASLKRKLDAVHKKLKICPLCKKKWEIK